jgi:hypothetical protein
MMFTVTGYDIIGDVHGCADKLTALLRALGYQNRNGTWRHSGRQAIFVGDLIDRGDRQLESVAIARAMVDAGTAQMVIGNHEFNAVAYATKNETGEWCRPHSDENNNQHVDFLNAIEFASPMHREILGWFMTLPLWLDLGGVRIVHACWNHESIRYLQPLVSESDGLTEQLVIDATTKGTATYDAIETVLKGPELAMGGCYYFDKDQNRRDRGRLNWWQTDATTIRDALHIASDWQLFDANGHPIARLPDTPIPADDAKPYAYTTPVIFGHYWFTGPPEITGPATACVDYSAVKGGPLVAYQWDGAPTLNSDNFISV